MVYLSETEKQVFKELIDPCTPQRITDLPPEGEGCAALLFEYSVYNESDSRFDSLTLVCLPEEANETARGITLGALTEQYGELTPAGPANWFRAAGPIAD